jgi:hypothetical protein
MDENKGLVGRLLRRAENWVDSDPGAALDYEAANRISALTAERDRLREALEPFAAMASAGDQKPKDDAVWAGQDGLRITYGDFRRARAALSAASDARLSQDTAAQGID